MSDSAEKLAKLDEINGYIEQGTGVVSSFYDMAVELATKTKPAITTAGSMARVGAVLEAGEVATAAFDGDPSTKVGTQAAGAAASISGSVAATALGRLASTVSTRALAAAGAELGAFAGPVGIAVGALVGAGLGYAATKYLESLVEKALSPPTPDTDRLRDKVEQDQAEWGRNAKNGLSDSEVGPNGRSGIGKPSAKHDAADPGGFGLGPGAQFGGNSNGYGSSKTGAPSSKQESKDPGGFGLGPGALNGGNSNGFGSSAKKDNDSHSQKDSKDKSPSGSSGHHPDSGGGSGSGSSSSSQKPDKQNRPASDPGCSGPQPILLDLDGNGVTINELSRSTVFKDAGGDGLMHRTAWAGAGDGVLFFDADADGTLSQKREYVFTEWDPTAATDMEALRAYFDTNGDGKLTAADADGATTAKPLNLPQISRLHRDCHFRRAFGGAMTTRPAPEPHPCPNVLSASPMPSSAPLRKVPPRACARSTPGRRMLR